MSGTPPFCSLGSTYYLDDLTNPNRTFTSQTPYILTTYNNGTIFTYLQGQAYEEYSIPIQTYNTNTEHTVSLNYYFNVESYIVTLSYGGYNSFSTSQSNNHIWIVYNRNKEIYISVYGSGNFFGYGYVTAPSSGNIIVEFKNILKVYLNGNLVINQNNPLSLPNYITELLIGGHANTGAVYTGNNYGIISDLSIEGIGLPNNCLGEIPTFHKEIDSSTAKISHSRILREQRTSNEAQRFHDWMANA